MAMLFVYIHPCLELRKFEAHVHMRPRVRMQRAMTRTSEASTYPRSQSERLQQFTECGPLSSSQLPSSSKLRPLPKDKVKFHALWLIQKVETKDISCLSRVGRESNCHKSI